MKKTALLTKIAKPRRKKLTGHLFKRGDFWYARWTRNGIRETVSTGIRVTDDLALTDGRVVSARDRAEAFLLDRTEPLRMRHREDAIALIERQLLTKEERLRADIETVRSVPRVGDLADLFEHSSRRPDCSADMMVFYKRVIAKFAKHVGPDTAISDVDRSVSGRYAAELSKNAAAGTFNKAVNALTLVWKCVGRDIGIDERDNPWADITRKKPDTHVRRCFTEEEVERILDTAKGEMRVLFAIGLYTGLRLGDAVHVRWEDFRGDEVFVKTAKTGAKVAIPIHPRLAEAIGKRKRSGYLVPGIVEVYDSSTRNTQVNRMVARVLTQVGIKASFVVKGKRARPESGFHSCRVYFISSAVAAGVPIDVVRGIVGHTEVRMTEHYFRVESDAAKAAFRRIR